VSGAPSDGSRGVARRAWSSGSATGIGSLPGHDIREAVRLVLGELPDFPHLPELPARGPGADLIGRAAALLVDLPVDRQPAGWRLVDRPGVDERRARALLGEDLDAVEEFAGAHDGPFKVQVAGPWTLSASLELARGERALHDPGAVRDIVASLAEGLSMLTSDLRRRLPRARLFLQLDEPSLPAVLAGRVPTQSGYGTLRSVAPQVVQDGVRSVLDAVRPDVAAVVHCCARDIPVELLRSAGAGAISLDLTSVGSRADEALGDLVEAGGGLLLGVVPATDSGAAVLSDVATTVAPVRQLWRRLGLPAETVGEAVVVTPTCGLAGASPQHARAAMTRCREAARSLADDPEGTDD
jgi:methionine synthase II (cobalamin-independent)